MKPKSNPVDQSTAADEILKKLFLQARAQFGEAIKYHWFYDGDLCPACAGRSIDMLKYEGQDAVSLNAFIYRARGVLIGYFLCPTCARQIFQSAEKNPYHQTPLHAEIERNLIAAYHKRLKRLNA